MIVSIFKASLNIDFSTDCVSYFYSIKHKLNFNAINITYSHVPSFSILFHIRIMIFRVILQLKNGISMIIRRVWKMPSRKEDVF